MPRMPVAIIQLFRLGYCLACSLLPAVIKVSSAFVTAPARQGLVSPPGSLALHANCISPNCKMYLFLAAGRHKSVERAFVVPRQRAAAVRQGLVSPPGSNLAVHAHHQPS